MHLSSPPLSYVELVHEAILEDGIPIQSNDVFQNYRFLS